MSSRRLALVSLLAVSGICAGCDAGGRIVVTVGTNYRVPAELAFLRVTTRDSAGGTVATQVIPLEAEGGDDPDAFALPLSFTVAPAGGDHARAADIEVAGIAPGGDPLSAAPVVTMRHVVSGFVAGQQRVLPMFLFRSCEGFSCTDLETCTIGGEGTRCTERAVDAESLSILEGPVTVPPCAPLVDVATTPEAATERVAGVLAFARPNDSAACTVQRLMVSARPGTDVTVVAGMVSGQCAGLGDGASSPVPEGLFVANLDGAGVLGDVVQVHPPFEGNLIAVEATPTGAYLVLYLGEEEPAMLVLGRAGTVRGPATVVVFVDADGPSRAWDLPPRVADEVRVAADGERLVVAIPTDGDAPVSIGGSEVSCGGGTLIARLEEAGASVFGCTHQGPPLRVYTLATGSDGAIFFAGGFGAGLEEPVDLGGGPRTYAPESHVLVEWNASGQFVRAWEFTAAEVGAIAVPEPGSVYVAGLTSVGALGQRYTFGPEPYGACWPGPSAFVTRLDAGAPRWGRVLPLLPGTYVYGLEVDGAGGARVVLASEGGGLLSLTTPSDQLAVDTGFLAFAVDADGEGAWLQYASGTLPPDRLREARPLTASQTASGALMVAGRYFLPGTLSFPANNDTAGFVVRFAP